MKHVFNKFALILAFSFTVNSPAAAGENTIGLLAEDTNSFAPAETAQWDKMIGNWNVVNFQLNPEGEVTREFQGEWNWSYILNGHAIQDVFIIPGRSAQTEGVQGYFYGTNVRSYNTTKQKWDVAWVSTQHNDVQLWEAEAVGETLVMTLNRPYMDSVFPPEMIRVITFYDITDTHFSWRNENSMDGGETWTVTAKIEGTKVTE